MAEPGLEVHTVAGRVQGAREGLVRVWRGIPYAAPPVGALRWRPPQPAPAWTGVRPALAFGADFPQAPSPVLRAGSMSEDCLYLNVWAPAAAAPGSLPVMVWLHGGGFTSGSGADTRCDGAALARAGVVVVTFNYRSGVFGFLAHPGLSRESEHRSSGNYGLQDQVAALRWVRENIAGFGGDPQRVTAFGVSAGSASIALLLTLTAAEGLFQRAILHSPGTARPLATLAEAEAAGAAIDADIGALRALGADQVLALTTRLNPAVRGLTTPRVLRPIRDGWLVHEDERPAFLAGRLQAMPLIVGTNRDEGTLLTRSWPVERAADNRRLLVANFARDLAPALAFYGSADDAGARAGIAAAFADTQFNYGARLLLRSMVARGQPCWRYLFTRRRPGQADGPHHGDEVGYVFGNLAAGRGAAPEPFDDTDHAVAAAMAAAWVAFARDGDPGAPAGMAWRACSAADDSRFEFGDRFGMAADDRRAPLDFLERYYSSAG